jgi:hypothetical protein
MTRQDKKKTSDSGEKGRKEKCGFSLVEIHIEMSITRYRAC